MFMMKEEIKRQFYCRGAMHFIFNGYRPAGNSYGFCSLQPQVPSEGSAGVSSFTPLSDRDAKYMETIIKGRKTH